MNSWLVSKRVAWITKLLFFMFIIVGLTSCASYDRSYENPNKLDVKSVYKLGGSYQARSNVDSIEVANEWNVNQRNFLTTIDREDTLKIDRLMSYSFTLEINSPKSITIFSLENERIFDVQTFKTRLKKNGYLQLKNKNLRFWGVPLIFGGYRQERIRISIDNDQALVVDTAYDTFGSVFFMVGGNSGNQRSNFKPLSIAE